MLNRRLLYLTRARKKAALEAVEANKVAKLNDQDEKDKLKKWLDKKGVKFHPQLGLKKLKALKKETEKALK